MGGQPRRGDHPVQRDRPAPGQGQERGQEDAEIQPERPVPHVQHVVVNPLVEVAGVAVAPTDLPQAGDARPDRQASVTPRHAELVLAKRGGPRPDQAHLPQPHVDQLRQLVDVGPAQPVAERRDPVVVGQLELRTVHEVLGVQLALPVVGVMHHGAELPATERAAVQPLALVAEQHRPARRQFDEHGHQHQQRRNQHQAGNRHQQVKGPLEQRIEPAAARVPVWAGIGRKTPITPGAVPTAAVATGARVAVATVAARGADAIQHLAARRDADPRPQDAPSDNRILTDARPGPQHRRPDDHSAQVDGRVVVDQERAVQPTRRMNRYAATDPDAGSRFPETGWGLPSGDARQRLLIRAEEVAFRPYYREQ